MDHPDVQAVEDIMMQLLKKRRKVKGPIEANDLHRWSSTAQGFWSKIPSASVEKAFAGHLGSFSITIILFFEACFLNEWMMSSC